MCNLYRMTQTTDEIARLFQAIPTPGANYGLEVYPGYPGLVVAQGRAQAMTWGFPLVLKGKQGQPLKPKPVTNAREDKLTTPFWRDSFASRRCLIPVSAWAEAEGEKGRMTRTWYALPGGEPFAVAGLWRRSAEWGQVYSMVMVEGSPLMSDVHDRMPLILSGDDRQRWTEGAEQEALALCHTWQGPLLVDRTTERWAGTGGAAGQANLL
jgi:putative SOS response-associated peptidase YedK